MKGTPRISMAADAATRAAEAVLVSSDHADQTWSTIVPGSREFFRQAGEDALAGQASRFPDSVRWQFNALPAEMQREFLFTAQMNVVRRLWRRHRVVYDVDPTLWQELGDSALSDRVPHELFRQLPHPNPFVAFPEPLILGEQGGLVQHVVGVFVSGRFFWNPPEGSRFDNPLPGPLEVQCSTDNPDMTLLGLSFAGMLYHPDGRPYVSHGVQDMMWTHTSLAMDRDYTVGEMWKRCSDRFNPLVDDGMDSDPLDDLGLMLRRAISLIVYLCASNADLRPVPGPPPARRRKGPGKQPPKPPKVVAVGYRIGAKIRAYRSQQARRPAGEGTGREKAPHIRRAHFHEFRHGKGRQLRKVKWLPPLPIKMGDEDAGKTTVIKVD